jgi:hypothetical protein
MKPRLSTLLFTFSTIIASTFLQSAAAQSQEKIYSVYMVNFVKGIQWPETDSKFVIGILAYPPLAAELNQAFSTAKIKNHTIEIREYTSVEEIERCQMIFIPAFKARSFDKLITKVGATPTLIVSNKMDMAKKGAGINFTLVDGKPKYEINCKTIEKRGMKISTTVKGMGILVE